MKRSLMALLLILSVNTLSSESIGFYRSGSLKESVSFDDFNNGEMTKLFRSRNQLYMSLDMAHALTGLSNYMRTTFPQIEKTQVGDLSAKEGRKIPRHKSHQNGLDADIVYYRSDGVVQAEENPEWEQYFVVGGKLSPVFSVEKNWAAFKFLVNTFNAERIFVDQKIKKRICKYAEEIGELGQEEKVLRALRPENSVHKTHFHFRLKCPPGNKQCVSQTPPPEGSGC